MPVPQQWEEAYQVFENLIGFVFHYAGKETLK